MLRLVSPIIASDAGGSIRIDFVRKEREDRPIRIGDLPLGSIFQIYGRARKVVGWTDDQVVASLHTPDAPEGAMSCFDPAREVQWAAANHGAARGWHNTGIASHDGALAGELNEGDCFFLAPGQPDASPELPGEIWVPEILRAVRPRVEKGGDKVTCAIAFGRSEWSSRALKSFGGVAMSLSAPTKVYRVLSLHYSAKAVEVFE